jgi:prophage tail gpP-like protein
MSEKVPNTFQNTHLIPDAATLFVNGAIYGGWEDLKIVRELNAAAGDFTLQLTDRWQVGQEPWRIQAGDAAHVHLGKSPIATGYIDKVEASISASSRTITISGRSKTGDIVDCSVEGASEYSGLTISEIAKKLCAPFSLSVTVIGDAGAPFDKITVQPGETVFTLIDRLARERKLLMYPSLDGNLVLSTVGNRRAASEIRQGANLLSGKSTFDNSNRHSVYKVLGNGFGFIGDATQAASPTGQASDAGITRYRPLVLVSENAVNDGTSGDRASYESNLRAAKALKAEVQVQGWYQAEGRLWNINEIVYLDAGFLGLRRDMLIEKVEYNKGNAGTTCSLSLIRADAYGFTKKVNKEDPMSWQKALK